MNTVGQGVTRDNAAEDGARRRLGVLAHGLSPAQVERLAACARQTTVPMGTMLLTEGERANRFYLIRAGVVAITMRVPNVGERLIETLLPGHLLGWSWLQPPYRWRFSALAREPVVALEFDAVRVRQMCEDDPAMGQKVVATFLSVVTARLRASRMRLLDLYLGEAAQARRGGVARRMPGATPA